MKDAAAVAVEQNERIAEVVGRGQSRLRGFSRRRVPELVFRIAPSTDV